MEENNKIFIISLTKEELTILSNSIANSIPDKSNEAILFKLYHKLLFKLNERV